MQPDTIERSAAADAAPAWWKRPYRMVQTNLRQPDALYDQRKLARETREFGADVLLYNIGGIFAFYPTKLKLHAVNPLMKGDALGDAIEAAHAEGLSLVGRFDMSKATRIAYEAHPDWFVHNIRGDVLEYNGTYQACVNGGWYQDYSLQIISEALGKYDVDGVFFNMFGYTNFTYSGDYFGICVCENCRRRFRAMYRRELPLKEDFSDPAYPDYLAFKERTSLELRAKVYRHIKAVNPKVAMTGHRGESDLIRMEVQRAVDRPQPEWPYQAGEQARWAAAYGQGKTFSSTSTNFVDFAWRFHSETGGYHMLRFAQQLASGAALDYYLLGVLDQDDKTPFEDISRLFHWHKEHEAHYRDLRSAARIGLYHSHRNEVYRKRTASAAFGDQAFRGAYRMLVESRLPFDFVSDDLVAEAGGSEILARYDAILIPNISCLSDEEASVIDRYVENGGIVVVTGDTGLYDERGAPRDRPALKCLPIEDKPSTRLHMRGAYLRIEEGELPLPQSKLLMLDDRYFVSKPKEGSATLMKLLPPQRFGPPELCFPDFESELPGVIVGSHGKGKAIYVPWNPDWQYYRDSLPSHRVLVADLIERNIPPAPVRLEGKGSLEVTIQQQESTGRLLVHVVNFGGQRNNLYEDAAAVHGLRLGIRGAAKEAVALVSGKTVAASKAGAPDDGYTWFELPPVEAFEAISVKREG
ncbi:alpha-amylase family protein [Rhizobium sp. BK251]|uniref:alpha-amylase family protein n=1 Tax=Rhizobium sp. BK251 TaxID=2512125 RepID=UPI001045CA7E|nr:alpha-amylase family protein [Rhizobium sp. BK251]TCL68174.1 beta-galactosidase-like protein [Rhizobium sp. BK251]